MPLDLVLVLALFIKVSLPLLSLLSTSQSLHSITFEPSVYHGVPSCQMQMQTATAYQVCLPFECCVTAGWDVQGCICLWVAHLHCLHPMILALNVASTHSNSRLAGWLQRENFVRTSITSLALYIVKIHIVKLHIVDRQNLPFAVQRIGCTRQPFALDNARQLSHTA